MKTLVDTCVIIDFFRNFPPSVEFFRALNSQPRISSITIAELYAGAKTKKKKALVEEFVKNCIILDIDQEIAEQGGEWSCQYTPSHGVDLPDALIAATAYVHELQLATCNLKHFPMFPELKRPY